jgi:O-antigen/teichoic acid export membrane protein
MSDPSHENLPTAVRQGALWVIGGQVASQIVSLGSLLVLYRLVDPQAFGLFGMALPFVLLPRTLAVLGLSAAAVQRHELTGDERSLVFWMQTGVGIIVTIGTYLLATSAAWLYGVEAVAPLVRALAATVIIASLSATHQALLERRLQLARVTIVRVTGQLLGVCVAVIAASRGWQTGALVVQQYSELLALLVASWVAEPWLPGWPRRGQHAWRELAAFGGYYSLSSLLFVLVQNVDKLLLGVWLGETSAGQAIVGAYTQAYNLMMRPVHLVTTPLSGMLLPALSRAVRHPTLFADLTVATFQLAAIALAPVSVGVLLVAGDAIPLLGGPKWTAAGLLLAALAPMIAPQAWINLCGSVLGARNRTALLCFGAVVLLMVTVQATAAGWFFGSEMTGQPLATAHAIAWALSLTIALIVALPYVAMTALAAEVPPWRVIRSGVAPLRASAIMGVIVMLVTTQLPDTWPAAARIGIQVAIGVAVYVLLAWRELAWLVTRLRTPRDQGEVTRVHDGGSLAGNDSSDAS